MRDQLLIWREVRDQVPWSAARNGTGWPVGPVRASRDGIVDRIATVEHDRDPVRAQRFRTAYDQLRVDAAADEVLVFELLASWQRTVLGTNDAPFRSGPAYAKDGRERYGLDAETPARFADCLADSRDPQLPVAARAARLYLDVCFFHPFADGNARSALLALAFVLAKDAIVLDQVGPIAQVQRPANDSQGAAGLADLVAVMIEGTQRRLSQSPHGAAKL